MKQNKPTEPNLITEVDESKLTSVLESELQTARESELIDQLETNVADVLEVVESETDRKTTIDSITTTVPSSVVNTPERNFVEGNRAEAERLRRRHLGY